MGKAQPDREADVPVQRLRIRYAKRGRLRFTSHRDFQRALERALRRAGVPIAFSGGFSPHPRVSYAGAAPTGSASEAEYLEIALAERTDPERVRADLDASLPDGLDVLAVVEAAPGTAALPDLLTASVWEIALPGLTESDVAVAVREFLAAEQVEVERLTKKGMRRFDARAAVVECEVSRAPARSLAEHQGDCAILRLVVRHGTPAVRPDDVLAGLRVVADLRPPSPPAVTRLGQGPLDEGTGEVLDPFAPETRAARSS
ncbi:MAG TPA: TIGR03936 family radical SAM-associated protein [Streptosporangiales bacterium]